MCVYVCVCMCVCVLNVQIGHFQRSRQCAGNLDGRGVRLLTSLCVIYLRLSVSLIFSLILPVSLSVFFVSLSFFLSFCLPLPLSSPFLFAFSLSVHVFLLYVFFCLPTYFTP